MTTLNVCTPVDLPAAEALATKKGGKLDNPLALVGDVKIKLEFVMGTATLSIEELTQLTTGSAIKLDEDLGSQVTIRLNGQDVGYGLLVNVDGSLGVQVKHLER